MNSTLRVTRACVVRVANVYARSFEVDEIVFWGSSYYFPLLWSGLATETGEESPVVEPEIGPQPVIVDHTGLADQVMIEWSENDMRWEVTDIRSWISSQVASALASVIDNAPEALDTLREVSLALDEIGIDIGELVTSIDTKAPKASPTFTGTVSGITKSMVGLGNVDNTSDANKPVSTAQQTALNAKENTLAAGTTAQYYRGDKTWQTLNKTVVGLANVDNTSDANKPVSTAQQTALNAKENSIAAGTTADYWAGDKTWKVLNKAAVGLSNVDNVQQQPMITAGTTAQYYRGDKTWQTLNKAAVGLSAVDNTSDANKPVSTAQQTALNAKQNLIVVGVKAVTDRPETYGPGVTFFETSDAAWPEQYGTVLTHYINVNRAWQTYTAKVSTRQWIRTADTVQSSGWTPWREAAFIDNLTKTAVGLGNVDNTSDVNKPVSTAQAAAIQAAIDDLVNGAPGTLDTLQEIAAALADDQNALDALTAQVAAKENSIAAGTTAQYWRGDKTWQALTKASVGLSAVDNTSDANKPVSTAQQTALNAKENAFGAGTTAQYLRGDKTWQTLNKAAVGLSNVDNTSDAAKPISTATQTALNGKAESGHSHVSDMTKLGTGTPTNSTFLRGDGLWAGIGEGVFAPTGGTVNDYLRGDTTWQVLNKAAVGLGNVDNTSDANKPISTATQTALNGKENALAAGTTAQYYRGDKTWQTLNSAAVGLGSVPNVDMRNLSNATSGTIPDAQLPNRLKPLATIVADADTATHAGNYALTNTSTNTPVAGQYFNLTVLSWTSDGTYCTQIASDVNSKKLYYRQETNSAWGAWQEITGRQAEIVAGTTAQYWRGDKTWQALNKAAVGLSNVDNTSDAAKPVSTAVQTALNGKANSTHTHGAGEVTSGVFTPARLGTGSVGDGSRVLLDNGTWGAAPGGGVSVETITPSETQYGNNGFVTKASMPGGRTKHAVVTIGNIIYVVGGSSNPTNAPTNSLYAYDTVTNTWTTKANCPVTLQDHVAGAVDGKIYAIKNGYVYVYDPVLNSWTSLTRQNNYHDVTGAASVTYNGKIFFFGGGSSVVKYYEPAVDVWTTMPNGPSTSANLGVALGFIDGRAYAFTQVSATIHAYDLETGSMINTVVSNVAGNRACRIGSSIYFYNGTNFDFYNPLTGASGVDVASEAVNNINAHIVEVNKKVYILGGQADNYTSSSAVLEFYPQAMWPDPLVVASGPELVAPIDGRTLYSPSLNLTKPQMPAESGDEVYLGFHRNKSPIKVLRIA